MKSYWRTRAAPIIAKLIAEHGFVDSRELRRAIRDAYPFGAKKRHPYKMWRKEVRSQLRIKRQRTILEMEPFQPSLFGDAP